MQSFERPRRKADVVTRRRTIRHYYVNVKHAAGTVWPDFALSSETSRRLRRADFAPSLSATIRGLAKFGLPDEASRSSRRRGEVWRRGELNPCFLRHRPRRSSKGFIREDSKRVSRHGNAWMELDVISFVIRWASVWNAPRNRRIGGTVARLEA